MNTYLIVVLALSALFTAFWFMVGISMVRETHNRLDAVATAFCGLLLVAQISAFSLLASLP